MVQQQDGQINHAPAVSLDSADYLTNRKTIKEYQTIQVQHLHQPSLLERLAQRPAVRRFARNVLRLIMILIAIGVGAALLYYLELDASLATGE